jgi:hypothetical protein
VRLASAPSIPAQQTRVNTKVNTVRHISSRKSVNPLALTASTSALNPALSLAAQAADKKANTPVSIIADRGRITFYAASLRSYVAITATCGRFGDEA